MFLTTFWLTRRQQQSGDELSAQQVLLEPVTLQKVMEYLLPSDSHTYSIL